jgi:hypothetical protein
MSLIRQAIGVAVLCAALASAGALADGREVPGSVLDEQAPVTLIHAAGDPAIAFGAGDLRAAFEARGLGVDVAAPGDPTPRSALQVVVTTAAARMAGTPIVTGLSAQGYAIRRTAIGATTRVWVIGFDGPGAMYGALELAEAVRIDGGLQNVGDRQTNPRIARRGIKFNIPLDARTPSYSDDSSSAQANIAEMWSMDFWTAFLDRMARERYNFLSLWSLSPFPSLVRVPDYPNVALADVKKKAGPLWDATLTALNMYDPAWPLETVKTMTIDEKIAFWRQVMQHARDRGIEVSLFTWNIFTYGTEPSGYGITDSPSNQVTRDYVRKSVRALFNTYPLLAGIGITSGEHMEGLSAAAKEEWLWDTYGRGTADAMADARNPASPYYQPGRVIRLIHRAHQADLASIVSHFSQLPGSNEADSTLAFSFKYSEAHMHASAKPLFIYQRGWFDSIPPGKQTWLTVRNDDFYYMRWGDPDFARAYLMNLPDLSKIAGFYMGPDGYTWGREFVGKAPDSPRQLVIDKMWYSFLIWGRLAYDPTIPNSRFEQILGARFPSVPSRRLYDGWASVSRIVPRVSRLYWGNLDFRWYPEASWSLDGYESVQKLIDGRYRPMSETEDGQTPRPMSVKAFVSGEAPAGRLTPLEVADLIQQDADAGMRAVDGLSGGADTQLQQTLGDIRAMAWLGRYYAEKIRGAVSLARHQNGGAAADHARATEHLRQASAAWREYAAIWSSQYVGQQLTRMGSTVVDMAAIQAHVDRDIPAPIGR